MLERHPPPLAGETLLQLGALSRELRKSGVRIPPCTLARWARVGIRGERLEAARRGRSLLSNVAAVKRFVGKVGENVSFARLPESYRLPFATAIASFFPPQREPFSGEGEP